MDDLSGNGRVPVRFGTLAEWRGGEAVLIEGDAMAPADAVVGRFRSDPAPFHPAGCACCAPRGAAADALHRLHLDLARSIRPMCPGVVVVVASDAGREAVRAALRDQSSPVSAWFRLLDG